MEFLTKKEFRYWLKKTKTKQQQKTKNNNNNNKKSFIDHAFAVYEAYTVFIYSLLNYFNFNAAMNE